MLDLIRLEWIKTFGKLRTYIGFVAIGVVIPLTYLGLKFDQGQFLSESPTFKMLHQNFITVGNLFNGLFATQLVMNFLWVHIPFLIALVAGDQVAGEATAGTIRMILVRPPSREKILLAKAAVTLIYTAFLVLFMAVLSLGLGFILFGSGDLLVLEKGILILPEKQAWLRFLLAYPLAILAMSVVAALAFLFSVLVENSIGPIIGTMAIVIVSVIITQTPIALFAKIRPFLFTTYTNVWQKAFLDPLPWGGVISSVLYLFLFMGLFFGLALIIFNRKDILS